MRVSVLGQGSIGRRHAANFRDLGCAVTAYDPQASEIPEGVTRAASEDAALEQADAVVVASPSSLHLEQARRALSAGCHLLVEKPLATTADSVGALVQAARDAGRILAVAMNVRFHPGPAAVAEHVRSGRVGRPLTAHFHFGSHLPDWRPQIDYRQTYSARSELGGGVLLDVVHELDLGCWMLGAPRRANATMARLSDLEIDVEDTVMATVEHGAGTLATYELDYLDRAYRRGCRVVGTEATAEWDWRSGRARLLAEGEVADEREVSVDFAGTYRDEAAAFLECARTGVIGEDSPLGRGEDGETVMALVEAMRASAGDAGRAVAL